MGGTSTLGGRARRWVAGPARSRIVRDADPVAAVDNRGAASWPAGRGPALFDDAGHQQGGEADGLEAVGPLVAPGRARRVAPFLLAAAVCLAAASLTPGIEPAKVAAAAAVTVVISASLWVVPWRRLPVVAQAVPVFAGYIGIVLMRDGSGGADSPFTPVVLLPLVWLALYHGWGLVVAGLIATEASLLGPLLAGTPRYPPGQGRDAVILGVVGTVMAVGTRMLVARTHAAAQRLVTTGARLHRQHEFATAVLDSTNTLIMVVDTDGRIVGFNRACEALTGYRADEVRGRRPWHVLARREDRPARARRFAERLAMLEQAPPGWDTVSPPYEIDWLTREGHRRRTRWTDAAIHDERGNVTHLVATGADVTDQRQTEELLGHTLAAATEQALIAADLDGLVMVFNVGAERMLGYAAEEIVGRATPEVFHDPAEVAGMAVDLGVPADYRVFFALAERNDPDTRQWTYIRRDGSRLPVELTISVLRDHAGESIGYLGVARDITAEQAARAALREAYEREHASVARMRELERARAEFIAAASHDLRTPLTSIIAYQELLLEPSTSSLTDDDRQLLATAHRNAYRLLALIGDLLVISKIDSGTFAVERRPVALVDVVRGAMDAVTPSATGRDIDLRVALPDAALVVNADPHHLERVLINLMSNAVKFTPDGGQVRVEARAEGDRAVISVADTGVGIPASELPHVFERFYRSTGTRHTVAGTGLGLPIAKAIVEAHRGSITVDSTPGRGTTVTVAIGLVPE